MPEEELYRSLGLAVAARRRSLGLTQAQVASAIGLTRAALANIESGRQGVLLHHLYRLVAVLGLESIIQLAPSTFVPEVAPGSPRIDGVNVTDDDRAHVERVFGVSLDAGGSLAPSPS